MPVTVSASNQPVLTSVPGSGRDTPAIVGGIAAAVAFGVGMLLLRSTIGVRSIPERLMEWLLLFIPPSAFEAMLRQFGFDAKRYGLDAAVILMLGVLAGVGYLALHRGWPTLWLLGLGLGVWLVIMLGVMPLTSAGPFASALPDGAAAAIFGYLAISLTFAGALALVRTWIDVEGDPEYVLDLPETDRRALLVGLGGTAVAYGVAFASSMLFPSAARAPAIVLLDPQEPVPSGGLDEPNPHPQAVTSPSSPVPQAAGAPTRALPIIEPRATPGLPRPAPERELQRDKDGAVLPSGRPAGQLAAGITSNSDFYVVTKNAGGDPDIRAEDWRLLVDGEVQRSFQLDYATLRRLPVVEVTKTLECISNFVGKPELAPFGAELISTAQWKGVAVRDILALTGGPKASAVWLAVLSADEFTSALPMDVAMDPATLLVYEMNGEVLPFEHGYPARLLVPGRYGMKNPKWVIGMRPMTREFLDWYGQRNWSKDAVVRTMSRIDSPGPGDALAAGANTVSGVAYAGMRGIRRVEFTSDGGDTWQEADLVEDAPGPDAWVRWRGSYSVAPRGKVALLARATDGTGAVQEQAFTLPEPNGGTGWPHLELS
jgi:DMSO/TMAO reductase YedYZ molybdopterin-dependent catalytic subunit